MEYVEISLFEKYLDLLLLVNNCVGQLNYRYFCNFLLSCSLLSLIAMIGCIVAAYLRWNIYKNEPGLFIAYNVPTFLVGIVGLMFFITLSTFWCYHCGLTMSGTTTREDVNSKRNELNNAREIFLVLVTSTT